MESRYQRVRTHRTKSARIASRRSMNPVSRAQRSGSTRARSSGSAPMCSLSQSGSMVTSPSSASAIWSNTERISRCRGLRARPKLKAARRLIVTGGKSWISSVRQNPCRAASYSRGGTFLVPQDIQVARNRVAGDAELLHEVHAVGRIPFGGAFPHHLDHPPNAVILRSRTCLHFFHLLLGGMPLDDTPSLLQ